MLNLYISDSDVGDVGTFHDIGHSAVSLRSCLLDDA